MSKQQDLIKDIFDMSAHGYTMYGFPVEPWNEENGDEPHYYINDPGVDLDSPDLLPDGRYKVTYETVKRGLKLCKEAKIEGDGTTIKYLGKQMLREIIATAITGEQDCNWDINNDMAVVEIGLWGRVVYG